MEKLALLGSTGSIGTQALDVCRGRGYKPVALAAHSNVALMEKQIREFSPAVAALIEESAARDLKTRVADMSVKVLGGIEGVCECAQFSQADTVLNAVVGMAGLRPTVAAIRAKKRIALANKETLVAAGALIMDAARENGVQILPV
ncbi:MAG: 1-deoxy-D-xylulose-5-phosphate reductoisomerase, partial [Clostridiales bacterium]|nr:1-deoxy-D-xylulose-5-phosphate reductoisomerase [Clostridiales bacterium]